MCGISGFSGPNNPERLSQMNNLMTHRGPDGEGVYTDPGERMNLGHRRLAIIDLETGDQPLSNEDGTIWVVLNGEIYNYIELRRDLEATGRHVFATKSDTETLVHLYEEFGPSFLERLNGMFSIALWDENNGRLILARDRLGVKPLYWSISGGRLIFASEMKSILCWPEVDRRISQTSLSHYLTLRCVPEPSTIYDTIEALPPGHSLTWMPEHGPKVERYWKLDFTPRTWTSENEICDAIEEILVNAVQLRMRSDVPVGAFLSGGVDSSLVVAMMRQDFKGDFHTFSLGYSDSIEDKQDIYYARKMAEKFSTTHHELQINADDLANNLTNIVSHFDQPFSGVVSSYFLSRQVRDYVKVALTGDGADDQFASYGHHRLVWPIQRLKEACERGVANPYSEVDLSPLADRSEYLRQFEGMDLWQLRASFGGFPDEMKAHLVDTDQGRHLANILTADFLGEKFSGCSAQDDLNKMLEVDINTSLPSEVLFFCD